MSKNFFLTIILITGFLQSFAQKNTNSNLNDNLQTYCAKLPNAFDQIAPERKLALNELVDFISEQRKTNQPINLLFVCTSNSRRSHMAQVWAQVASVYYNVDSVSTFSGGTEQTRVNKNAIKSLEKTGIQFRSAQQSDNPIWIANIGNTISPLILFSKKYSDSTNPSKNFGAVMVCNEADQSCPIVKGALFRLSLPYQDPKVFDNSPQQTEKYDERCLQIATEMFYVFSQIKK